MKKLFILSALLILLAASFSVAAAVEAPPEPPTNVPNYQSIPWSPAGGELVECNSIDGDSSTEEYDYAYKFNSFGSGSTGTVNGNTITISNVIETINDDKTENILFDWDTDKDPIGAVVVKSATYANIWNYVPAQYTDDDLHAYDYRVGEEKFYRGISHITFCWNEGLDQASASAQVLGCEFGDVTKPVQISANGVIVRVYTDAAKNTNPVLTHHATNNVNPSTYTTLPAGTYYLGYEVLEGFEIPAGGLQASFIIADCGSKTSADASALVQACTVGDETEPVEIFADGVTINVYSDAGMSDLVLTHSPSTDPNPKTYTRLTAGTYYLDVILMEGYDPPEGGFQQSFTIAPCTKETADAYADPLGCSVGEITEPVEIYAKGVIVSVFGDSGLTDLRITHDPSTDLNPGTYEDLGQGTYYLDYETLLGYEIPEGGLQKTFDIGLCDSEKISSTASITLGACGWTVEDGSVVPVDIALTNAKLTLDGKVYESKSLVKTSVLAAAIDNFEGKFAITLRPGDYTYSWESIDPEIYVGSGKGTLIVKPCDPKEDKQPDLPSSGSAPSLINTAAPLLLSMMEIGLAWNFLDVTKKKNR